MIKNSLLVICLLLFSTAFVTGQTEKERAQIISHYDLTKLNQLEHEFEKTFLAERAEALIMAKKFGWPEEIKDAEGEIAILVGIFADGSPKYYQTHNRGAGKTTRADRVQTGGSAGPNLNGENMVAGVWDGGKVRATHILLENRVTQQDNATSFSDHATHVSGTMIGTGDVQSGLAKGMAPEATLLAYDFMNDEAEMTAAAATGLLISNHSYGLRIENLPVWRIGYYDDSARRLDNIAYNAPYYLPVTSAGNDRQSGMNPGKGGYDYLTDKAVSKNSIVSAAVYEVANYTNPSNVVMSSFSSWGPTDDGRIKPDLSGKGVNTFSSTSSSNTSFGNMSGTSMSSPNLAGSLILLQQYYNQINGSYMLSSTLRGLALHTADEAGSFPGPDYRFGWGLMNTERAAEVIAGNGTNSVIIEETLAQDEVYTFSVKADGINDLMASITWTDPAGTSPQYGLVDNRTPMLVNDLDLRISKDGGETFYPWKLNPESPNARATKGDNAVDNIEKIEIADATGEYIIRVSHKNNLRGDSQVFSLIVTGIEREDFAVSTHQGFQKFCPAESNSATYNIDLNFKDGFTDTVNFTINNSPAGVNASIAPSSLNSDGMVTLLLENINALAPGDYQLKVTATGTTETVNVYPILHITNPSLDGVILTSPEDLSDNQPVIMDFVWEDQGVDAEEYDFQLALDADFTNLVQNVTVVENQIQVINLLNNTQYFWRVRAKNSCGTGEFSDVFTFTTTEALNVEQNQIEGLVIYPNPAISILNIEADDVLDSVEIVNVLGQTLLSKKTEVNRAVLNISTLSAGNYFIKITSANKATVKQFVKK